MIYIRVLLIQDNYMDVAGVYSPGKKKNRKLTVYNRDEVIPHTTFQLIHENNKLAFRCRLPVTEGARYSFHIKKDPEELSFGFNSCLLNAENAYIETGDHIIKYVDREIRVYQASWKMRAACSMRFNKTLLREGKAYLIPLRLKAQREYRRREKLKRAPVADPVKPIVIIADRVNMARDNGEALFRYLMENGYDREYELYFALIRESDDYERLSRIGNILDFGSKEYKEKFLQADMIVTAGFDRWFSNAFNEDWKYMRDLYRFRHYFLTHGVLMNDWSKNLNFTKKGFRLYCATTQRERTEILNGNYGYVDEEVLTTGMSRYDLLTDISSQETQKIIAFLPTWRLELAGEVDKARGSRFYSDKIPGSEYQKFYNSLINHPDLLQLMRNNNIRGEFYLHPSFIANEKDFHGNDLIAVKKAAEYNDLLCRSSILITDYSSVNMDFAYMGKPLIYSQYDRDTFFTGHSCDMGYFDYELDGFGPICQTPDSVVEEIRKIVERNYRTEDKYLERAEKFFTFHDRNNRKRIAEAIFSAH